ncbi:winged helix-turn-helix domain-containing protein [Granulicella tundricola]|uniref:Transcriptional regulator, CadC n=1 Tax=Granulicella tundricola (strain ATCC BAA-1859 / DSM 23138 / MP5ACTX9) TaxID=1198114 RepID=E8X725_GRATM|nr:winged helix-turn-helix domain-containing protein [Granulicella tundricola]ADW71134.1 transcriptional regulator, CadC [Granulicella tundricola MP5ACTX9]
MTQVLLTGKGERISFGLFELDPHSGELWKSGMRVRLPGQPFKVLVALIRQAGEVVTREELQAEVWDSNTTVDFERALAGTINKIRDALGDSADNPRYVETLTKRGYRFIAQVTYTHTPMADAAPARAAADDPAEARAALRPSPPYAVALPVPVELLLPTSEVETALLPAVSMDKRRAARWSVRERVLGAAAAILLLALLTTLYYWHRPLHPQPLRIEQISHFIPIFSGPPNAESFLTLATDGDRILTSVSVDGRPRLSAIYISTGEVHKLATPKELSSNSLEDISKDGSKLLLRSQLSSESEQPLWVTPSAGGSGLRIGNVLAQDATWMPDGVSILYANGNDLYTVQADGGSSKLYATLQGRAFWMRWSPDGRLLRFTLVDPVTHSTNLYELEAGSRTARPVRLPGLTPQPACCGTWTADGGAYVFEASENLWELEGEYHSPTLIQLTNGPLRFFSPVAARSGFRIFFLGLEPTSGLQQFSEARHEFQPAPAFLADANRLD